MRDKCRLRKIKYVVRQESNNFNNKKNTNQKIFLVKKKSERENEVEK